MFKLRLIVALGFLKSSDHWISPLTGYSKLELLTENSTIVTSSDWVALNIMGPFDEEPKL